MKPDITDIATFLNKEEVPDDCIVIAINWATNSRGIQGASTRVGSSITSSTIIERVLIGLIADTPLESEIRDFDTDMEKIEEKKKKKEIDFIKILTDFDNNLKEMIGDKK